MRGELSVWDVQQRLQLNNWTAHKRSAITCVKFSHNSKAVYSCGEDCKVILWSWRSQTKLASLTGHQAPVCSVEMSMDGEVRGCMVYMVGGLLLQLVADTAEAMWGSVCTLCDLCH